ncbi:MULTISPECIES: DUF4184 family protein [unclassified Micromonospora]|uniref:DUF4184 family protein n=1 Tax=unclassified Micromonospora TaxID=2617518 RepID=UPI001B384AD6|nr:MULTISPECIES: DUF4184 family protein [unclassified Micromonospora]MBQ1043548.1 DUF4184 family protein [Micromonospora sp. C72]MBQ1053543.1 DUF4184 family protein [Micromonospora sp. C32]
MPLTFPSHLAPVLPLKLWRPRWFDGVALCAGAVAPDSAYLLTGTPLALGMRTHTLGGLLWWGLPVALAYAWVARRVVAGVAAHLPGRRLFGWPWCATLAGVRHPWQVSVCSALIGAFSHVAWDRVSHSERLPRLLGVADFHALTGMYWYQFVDVTAGLAGGLLVVVLAVGEARRGQRTGGAAPSLPEANPAVFWRVALAVTGLGALLLPALPAADVPGPAGVRALHVVALALVAGALAARFAAPRPAGRSRRLEAEQRGTG